MNKLQWGCFGSKRSNKQVVNPKLCGGIFFFENTHYCLQIYSKKIRINKNKQKYANIYKAESIQKHYLSYFIRKLRLGERK